jgi:hypothetical protein
LIKVRGQVIEVGRVHQAAAVEVALVPAAAVDRPASRP